MADPSNICDRASMSWPSATTFRMFRHFANGLNGNRVRVRICTNGHKRLNRVCEHVKPAGGSWVGWQTHRQIWIKHRECGSDAWMHHIGLATKPSIRDHTRAVCFQTLFLQL